MKKREESLLIIISATYTQLIGFLAEYRQTPIILLHIYLGDDMVNPCVIVPGLGRAIAIVHLIEKIKTQIPYALTAFTLVYAVDSFSHL